MDYYTPEICTNKNYNFSYGYFEMRAKLTSGNPLWHSFWACGQSYTPEKPYKAEIDVIETYSNGTVWGRYDYTVHSWWDKDSANLPTVMANDDTGHKVLMNDKTYSTLTSKFHNYGCLWTDTSITFYLDGKVLKKVVYSEDVNSEYYKALKDGDPMFLVLSLSTARENVGTINNSTLANQVMLVDYVCVYQDKTLGN